MKSPAAQAGSPVNKAATADARPPDPAHWPLLTCEDAYGPPTVAGADGRRNRRACNQRAALRNLSALPMTLTDDSDIAAAATTGDIATPNAG